MLDLILDRARTRTLRILCVGAHCDDVEIGCGGLLLALNRRGAKVRVDMALLSGTTERRREAERAHQAFVGAAHRGEMLFGNFPDGRFPARYAEIKDFIEAVKARSRPDVVLCHERDDLHQDHRTANEMVWNTFRDHLVLEYETPKWDGGLGQPNCFVPLTLRQAERKADLLVRSYPSQSGRDWFSKETFLALARLRGVECRAREGYAEAFHARKLRLGSI